MKIGLITFHDTTNFGSLLQTYGLYRKIIDLGYDCEIVDYQCESIVKREIPQPLRFSFNPKNFLRDLVFGSIRRKKYRELHKFLTSEMHLSKQFTKKTISQAGNEYDKFVIGSDITWGMDITGKDMTFFLDFVQDSYRRTAFAASIGNPWTEEEKKMIKPNLAKFDYIAVREEESADWIEDLIGNRPNVVCDPTMLISGEEWQKYCHELKDKDKYVLVYFDTKNCDCLTKAREYAKSYNLKVKFINYGLPQRGVEVVRPLSLEDFLSLINNAAFVITASYHGMLFSVYFNRPFAYYNRAHKSRMNTLARKLKVTDRDGSMFDALQMMPINYNKVNAAVANYRNQSIECLKELLAR